MNQDLLAVVEGADFRGDVEGAEHHLGGVVLLPTLVHFVVDEEEDGATGVDMAVDIIRIIEGMRCCIKSRCICYRWSSAGSKNIAIFMFQHEKLLVDSSKAVSISIKITLGNMKKYNPT